MKASAHPAEGKPMDQQEEKCMCEMPGCTMPGTICPICEQCFCWQHLQDSSCEACHRLLAHRSFEYKFGRLVSIGLTVMLCGFLFFFLPRDVNGVIIQVAILLLIGGALLFWLGLLAHS